MPTVKSSNLLSPTKNDMICKKHEVKKVEVGSLKKLKCRECNREYQRKWLFDNKEVQMARISRNKEKSSDRARMFIKEHFLINPCIGCGEKDFRVLTFDHRDREDKLYNVSEMFHLGIKKIKAEIEKCDVRCANCHLIRTAEQFGWWRSK